MDEKKIITMAKLAAEEKRYLKKDMQVTQYYQEDYVYLKNFQTRLWILCVSIGLMVTHVFLRLQAGAEIPTTGSAIFAQYIIPYGGLLITLLIFYSFASTVVYRKRYREAQKRIVAYREQLRALEVCEEASTGGEEHYEAKRKYFNATK